MKNKSKKIEILTASVPDREDVVTEVWIGDDMFGEIRKEGNDYIVQIYSCPNEKYWEISYNELNEIFENVKARISRQNDES